MWGRLREDAEFGSLPSEERVVGGELACASEGESQGGAGKDQDQLVTAIGNEDACRCVNQEQCTQHVDGQEGCEHPGQEANDQCDAAHKFKGCNYRGHG